MYIVPPSTLKIARCTVQYTLHTKYCILQSAHCQLHTTHYPIPHYSPPPLNLPNVRAMHSSSNALGRPALLAMVL